MMMCLSFDLLNMIMMLSVQKGDFCLCKESLYDRYNTEIENLLTEGYAEEVPNGLVDDGDNE